MRIGVLIGSVLPAAAHVREEPMTTDLGNTSSGSMELTSETNEFHIISRHGVPARIPPHKVNHRANVWALRKIGCEVVISICSTGALNREIPVPCFAIPDDYIDLFSGATLFDDRIEHITPKLDPAVQKALVGACRASGIEPRLGGTYIQTKGPRLETRAEVKLLANWADYVGMNLGPESTLVQEAGMRSGALLTVDNQANGIGSSELDFRKMLAGARSRWESVRGALLALDRGI